MNVRTTSSVVNDVQATCMVLCTALMLARPARQLILARNDLGPWFRGCVASVISLSKAVKVSLRGGDGAQDELHMHKRVLRVAVARKFFQIGTIVVLLWSPLELMSPDDREHMAPRRILDSIVSVSVVAAHVFPFLLNPFRLRVWVSIWTLGSALTLSPLMQSADSIPLLLSAIMYDCILFSVCDMCLPANLMRTAVLYGSAALTVFLGDSSSSNDSQFAKVGDMLIDFVLVCALVLTIDFLFSKIARLHLEGKTYRNDLRAAKSILAGVCDAVVEADLELRLVQPSLGLANLLMMNPRRCSAGESLQSFGATGADCEKFAQEVTCSITNDGICKAFHVSLRDSCGISVPMEVFCVPFHSSGGKESYLIGFREFADVPLPARRQQLSAVLPAARLISDVQSTLQSREAGTTDSSTSECETAHGSAVPEAWILIDALSPDLAMLRCSSTFELLAGASWSHIVGQRRSLLQCTQPDQRDDLAYWITHYIQEYDGSGAVMPPTVDDVGFRFTKFHHRFHLTIQNKVSLVLNPPDGQEWPVGLGEPSRVVKLILENPKWIRGGNWTRTKPNRASSPSPHSDPEPDRTASAHLLSPGPCDARGRSSHSGEIGAARGRGRERASGSIMTL